MAFQVSPGVNISEVDLTTSVPGVSTSIGAIAGVFRWGPVEERVLVSSENDLVNTYAKPTNLNAETFFTASSFLAYSNSLYVSRASHTTGNTFAVTAALETGNTQIDLSSVELNITVGDAVFGEGIPIGAEVAAVVNADAGQYELSVAPTATDPAASIEIFDSEYCFNAFTNTNFASLTSQIVKNQDDYDTAKDNFDSGVQFVAKYPGEIGNSLKVSVCDSATAFNSTQDLTAVDAANTLSASITFAVGSNTATIAVSNTALGDANSSANVISQVISGIQFGDIIAAGNTSVGQEFLKVSEIGEIVKVDSGGETGEATVTISFEERYTLAQDFTTSVVERFWGEFALVDSAPGQSIFQVQQGNTQAQDELHIVVIDEDGEVSGVPGTILEVFEGLSRATNAKTEDGSTNYYANVINDTSRYIWFANDVSGASSATAQNLTSSTNTLPYTKSFIGGRDTKSESEISVADVIRAYDLYQDPEQVDISLLMTGKSIGGAHGQQLGNYLIDNIAEKRKDCIVLVSPERSDVVNNPVNATSDTIQFRDNMRSTSYAVLDSGYKYSYDKYNDVYRFIPLNGDVAGLCAQTDTVRDPWYSPAGLNRGQIRNIVKLSFNPNRAQRDELYKKGINPVVNFPGQGIVLYGDKTLLAKPSSFDRINVRRLFIVLEKAIANSAKFSLFEFNDEFTRAAFVNLVTPFLRTVQGRRGITDYAVICDSTNNTPDVVDRNEFVGDIYIKPTRSINFIQLNFVAVRSGVEFSEVIGTV